MKLIILIIEFLYILSTTIFPSIGKTIVTYIPNEVNYQNLGIPLSSRYPDDSVSRSPWDMEVYDNKLFIGGGDYDNNTGPVPVYYYDLSTDRWENSGTVPDEQIEMYQIINDKLMIPGCDPQDNWDYGNIYTYNNGWNTNRAIPGGIHQFDLVEYHNMIFVALGVVPGEYPIAVSDDNGASYHQVIMCKNNVPIDTNIPNVEGVTSAQNRVYDLFVLNDSLYAYYCNNTNITTTLEIYKYHNGAFHYYCDFPDNIKTKRTAYRIFNAKVEFNSCQYVATGRLYVTKDMKSFQEIEIAKDSAVTDLKIINNKLYALVLLRAENGDYIISLRELTNPENNAFRERFRITFPCPALCFTYHNGYVYFGMGHGILRDSCKTCGTILSVRFRL